MPLSATETSAADPSDNDTDADTDTGMDDGTAAGPAAPSHTILIVDDRPTNRAFLLTLLGFTPHQLLEASDGAHALALARRERPDLVITDILMPTMDGYAFTQQLRADPQLADTPVIFFSATYSVHEMHAMAATCGVRTVLPKPSDPQTILDAVNQELGLGPDGQPPASPVSGKAAAAAHASNAELASSFAAMTPPTPALAAAMESPLVALGLRLNSERDGAAMAAIFTRAAVDILHAECMALCLLDSQESGVAHLCAHGIDPAVLRPWLLDRSALPGSLLDTTHIVRRAAPEGMLQGLPPGHPPVRNLLGLAIRDRVHLYGWLYFAGRRNSADFSQEDAQTAATLAAQLAVAYENMNLYQVVQRHAAQLQLEASARREADVALRASETRYRAMSESAPDAIVTLDDELHILHFNRAAAAMFGYTEEEMRGESVLRLLPERFRDTARMRYLHFRRTNEPYYSGRVLEVYGRRKNGEEFIAEQALSIVPLDGKHIYTAILRDTTQRRALESRLRLSARVFDNTRESIMMTDAENKLIAVNPAFEQITGYTEAEVLGQNPRLLRSGRHDAAFYRAMWESLDSSGEWRGEIWNRRKNGQIYPERASINAVRDQNGETTAYVSVSSDMTALKEAHHQLDFLANHDPLTLLPNRNLLNDRLQLAMAAAEHSHHLVAMLLFNVDRLQRINDSLGHDAGDALLQTLAQRLCKILTPGDTLAHLGGDEFALMLTKCRDVDDVIVATRQLMDSIAQPFALPATPTGQNVYVTASVGISIYPRDGNTPSALLIGADVALGHVKDAGRNGFRFYTGEMNAHALRFMSLETHLRHAVERGELQLVYQPQVRLSDGRIAGMEALLRWNSPELGAIPPADFIPLAEDTGLILEIGSWVLREACRQNRAWQQAGLIPMPVAVNVSARQLAAGNLPAIVRGALQDSGLSAQCLEIELTETVMMHDSEANHAQLAELADMGVAVALDDFGTGYSSLGYLSRYTLDKLKIDQAFVRNITTEPRSAAIAQATVALAHGLSLTVVAEGVETEGQLNYLRSIGCDKIQGYLFSRPLAADAMAAMLREQPMLQQGSLEAAPTRTLLLLDDEPGILYSLVRLFRREGYRALVAQDAYQALELLALHPVQVIISDQRMPGMSGTDFLARVRDLYPDTVRILLSGYADFNAVADAVNRGSIYKCISKPWDDAELKETVRAAFRHAEHAEERRRAG
ncbi:EAL domain-containing protein [Pseudoduganella sp. LjRoot289]|uniref:EAL domain-containing protein n=1 Tax=Pseudoduganella sp. LjRoot289 TaxID=3342314 RepID=UPI003ECF0C41